MESTFVFFDVAQTLLYKPNVLNGILELLHKVNPAISKNELARNHKLLSECIKFPDKTSKEFYHYFNSELVMSMGLEPKTELLNAIFETCTYQAWMPYEDTKALNELTVDMGIISNWDNTLPQKLKEQFNISFEPIICSQDAGAAKPDVAIFKLALKGLKKQYKKIIFVGDSIKLDIVPANSMGITTVLIDRDNVYPYFTGLKINSLYELKKHL